ncbi:TPM domain-containing protein [Nakamurella panacisegetis]|nr:TPM domain-containing protein [Nakamurella panacisegetis]
MSLSRVTSRSPLRAVLVALLMLCGILAGAGTASAEGPFSLPSQITDHNKSVGCSNSSVNTALADLRSADSVQLWVVFTDSFSGTSGESWAAQTFTKSGLGANTILLAVATKDRSFGIKASSTFPLDSTRLSAVTQQDITPKLSSGDWAGAVVAAADGYRSAIGSAGTPTASSAGAPSCTASSAAGSSGSKSWILWVVLLVLLGGGLVWYLRARKTKAANPNQPGGATGGGRGDGQPGRPTEPLEPLQSVSDRSVQVLIATDNAVRTSEQQLTLAESTFGAPAMADFRAAFERARTSLAAAFQLRQQIDDDIPEDDDTRRAWMNEIIQRCTEADAELDAQSDRFDAMLDLKNQLPTALTALNSDVATQENRVPDAMATLARLSSTYAPSALSTIINNAAEAGHRISFAREAMATAVSESTAADNTPAVVAARSAQEAVAQAKTLLDAIDKLSSDLADASAQLPARLAPVQAELDAARTAFGQGSTGSAGASIAQRLQQVETALKTVAGPAGPKDPILATQRVREADATLDDILAATRSAQETQQRALAALQQSLDAAQSKITGAGDFINTRRGAVGSEARTRLAEAQRHLSNALAQAGSDPAAALSESRQAESLADEAARLAQNDMGRWQGPGGGGFAGGGGGSFTGAVLGGILGGMLSGGGRGGGFGGFGGGGFGGGGFGGGGFGGGDSGGFGEGGRF